MSRYPEIGQLWLNKNDSYNPSGLRVIIAVGLDAIPGAELRCHLQQNRVWFVSYGTLGAWVGCTWINIDELVDGEDAYERLA
jgi:hypothetical protein